MWLSSAHVVCPKYGVYEDGNFTDIFNMADYPKSHSAWYLYTLLIAEVQRAELISVPKANLASDHRMWDSVVRFFCLSSALQDRKSQQLWGFPCLPGLHRTLQQSSGLQTAAGQRMSIHILDIWTYTVWHILSCPQKPPSAEAQWWPLQIYSS